MRAAPRATTSRTALIVTAVTVLTALTGCSGDAEKNAAPVEPKLQTTTTAPLPEPKVVATGEDFQAILTSFEAYSNWLHRNPRPEKLANIMAEGCACLAETRASLEKLADNNWRAAPQQTELTEVRVTRQIDANQVQVYVVVNSIDLSVEDENGEVVQDPELPPPTGIIYGLTRDTSGRWRISSRTVLGPAKKEAA